MKTHLSTMLCTAAIALTPLLFAQDDPFSDSYKESEQPLPVMIRTQVEYIELSLEQMTALMADPTAAKTDSAIRQRLTKLIKENKAKIIDSQIIVCRNSDQSTSESIHEYIYPTEYEPSELPEVIKIENGAETKVPNKQIATAPTPTAFETRNVGSTLEIKPTLSDNNQFIDLQIAPEIVYHVKEVKWSTWKDQYGVADIMMPVFYILRLNTATTLRAGKPSLIGTLTPKNDQGITDYSRKIMVFAKCDVITVGQ